MVPSAWYRRVVNDDRFGRGVGLAVHGDLTGKRRTDCHSGLCTWRRDRNHSQRNDQHPSQDTHKPILPLPESRSLTPRRPVNRVDEELVHDGVRQDRTAPARPVRHEAELHGSTGTDVTHEDAGGAVVLAAAAPARDRLIRMILSTGLGCGNEQGPCRHHLRW